MSLSREQADRLGILIGRAFSPATPIDERALFAGRTEQLRAVIDAINRRGQHAIIFGERGVGKTSLANVLASFLEEVQTGVSIISPRVNCDAGDDFASLWRKVFKRITEIESIRQAGFTGEITKRWRPMAERLEKNVRPDDVADLLTFAGAQAMVIVIIDELDRLSRNGLTGQLADTIKMLSDYSIPATLVLVGVADSVDDLIKEHHSIERALVQVRTPRMSRAELFEIIDRGLRMVEITIGSDAQDFICDLSQGLPHYTHLLALHSGREAIDRLSTNIGLDDVKRAIEKAVTGVQETIENAYHTATISQRRGTLFPQVLLACALANTDSMGTFAPGDVKRPMSELMKRPYDTPAFQRHLHSFCERDRGPVLHRIGGPHRYRFRFVNPLMQPYVIMRGLSEGLIDVAVVEAISSRRT